jgi:hypothetical protein
MVTDFLSWDAKVYYNVLLIYAVFNDSLGSASYWGGGQAIDRVAFPDHMPQQCNVTYEEDFSINKVT